MTRSRTALLVAAATVLFAACARSVRAPAPPQASAVDRIDVSYGPPQGVAGTRTERTIADRATIHRFVQFVEAHGGGWHEPLDTYPTRSGNVACRTGDRVVYSAWLGPNWIGGWEEGPGGRKGVRTLSSEEVAELREILGIAGD